MDSPEPDITVQIDRGLPLIGVTDRCELSRMTDAAPIGYPKDKVIPDSKGLSVPTTTTTEHMSRGSTRHHLNRFGAIDVNSQLIG